MGIRPTGGVPPLRPRLAIRTGGEGVSDPFPADSNRTSLWLNSNQLSGTIPSELGGLRNLERWRLRDNRLTGCAPQGLASVEDSDLENLGLDVCSGP